MPRMKFAAARSLPVLIGIAVALALPAARAGGDSDKDDPLQKKFESTAAKVAREHAKIARWCDKVDLYEQGYAEWLDVVELNPDDKRARERTGYELDPGGNWVLTQADQVDKQNKVPEDRLEQLLATYKQKRYKLQETGEEEFGELLEEAQEKGSPLVPRLAQLVLRYNPINEAARLAAGYVKKDGRWVKPGEEEPGAQPHPGEPTEQGPTKSYKVGDLTGEDVITKCLQLPVTSRESDHFIMVSTFLEKERLDELCVLSERSYDRFRRIFRVAEGLEISRKKITLVMLDTEEEYHKYCDTCFEPRDQAAYEFTKYRTAGGTEGKFNRAFTFRKDTPEEQNDWTVHYGLHVLVDGFARLPPWLKEAVSYEMTLALLGTNWVNCINDVDTGGRHKEWGDAMAWKELIRREVQLSKDTPLSTICEMNYNDINARIAAKCWSVLDWILQAYPDDAFSFLQTFYGKQNQDNCFEAGLGMGLEEADRAWRVWVRQNY